MRKTGTTDRVLRTYTHLYSNLNVYVLAAASVSTQRATRKCSTTRKQQASKQMTSCNMNQRSDALFCSASCILLQGHFWSLDFAQDIHFKGKHLESASSQAVTLNHPFGKQIQYHTKIELLRNSNEEVQRKKHERMCDVGGKDRRNSNFSCQEQCSSGNPFTTCALA